MIQDKDRLTVDVGDQASYQRVLWGIAEWWNSGPYGTSRGNWYRRNVKGLYRQARVKMVVTS